MQSEDFRLIKNMKNFIISLDECIINFPKSEKVLKDSISKISYEILENIYYANLINDKELVHKQIVSKLSMLDFYFEVALKKKYISEKKCNHYCSAILMLSKMTYGWIKNG